MSLRITVLYFAAVRETVGCSQESLTLNTTCSLAELRQMLSQRSPGHARALLQMGELRSAVNQVMCVEDDMQYMISDGAEVAFFPPVTGG